ncbi:MAG: permease [Candidatus Eisenbacteria bacterium]
MEAPLGAAVVALTLILAVGTILTRTGRWHMKPLAATTRTRTAVMAVLSVLAVLVVFPSLVPAARLGIFSFCGVCPIGTVATGGPESLGGFLNTFFLAAWYYTAMVLPVFVLGCLLSGVLIAKSRRFRIRGVLPAFGLAAALPVCSCGVIPIAKAMIERGGTGTRDGLVFLATAPLLSPIIMSLAFTLLGGSYLVLRVVSSLALALAVALLVRPFLSPPARTPGEGAAPDGESTSPGACATAPGAGGSVLLTGWAMLTGLASYVLFGVVLGSLFTAALPADYVGTILQSGVASMAAVVVIGVPINMCAGEEILLSAPLSGMGLTMGHALAFALASTGICMSSIPLLLNVLGRRATLVMVAIYLVVPFLIGVVVNALPVIGTLGPAPF